MSHGGMEKFSQEQLKAFFEGTAKMPEVTAVSKPVAEAFAEKTQDLEGQIIALNMQDDYTQVYADLNSEATEHKIVYADIGLSIGMR